VLNKIVKILHSVILLETETAILYIFFIYPTCIPSSHAITLGLTTYVSFAL
jgi:hypothetical protein